MVLVVDMEDGFLDDESLFDRFFSAFSCLAIPFPDRDTRLSICSPILSTNVILLDPNGLVTEADSTLLNFCTYGTDWLCNWFHMKIIDTHDDKLRSWLDPIYSFGWRKSCETISLCRDILSCEDYLSLERCDKVGAATVGNLSEKYVGLYICVDGLFMENLKEVHDHCLANNQELEIVVVAMSTFDDPKSHMKDLHEALDLCNIKSWFIYEPEDNICRRIYRIYGQSEIWRGDRFIIVPPNCKDGELEGLELITLLGIKEYPFTRSVVLQRRFDALNSLDIPSLLSNSLTCQLQNKKLLIYLAPLVRGYKDPTEVRLENHYNDIKARGWEVVYIPLDARYGSHYNDIKARGPLPPWDEMSWPCMSLSDAIEARVVEQLTFPEEEDLSYVIAVGEDGKIRSRLAEKVLRTEGLTESLFNNVLYQELALRLAGIACLLEHK